MNILNVDKTSCKGDGRCVEICPLHILKMNDKKRVPEFVDGGGDACINCGHCVAFCPPASLSLSSMDVKKCAKLDHSKLPTAEQVELLLKGRRSIRIYKEEPLKVEMIEQLIDIARYAPSGINRQPVNWAVVEGKEEVSKLSGLVIKWMEHLLANKVPMAESFGFHNHVAAWKRGEDWICRGAPVIIIAYGLKDDPMVPQSCTIAATYLELAAFGLGLGACWAGYVNMAINMSDEARKFVGLSSRATVGAAMMVGHSKYKYSRIPLRNEATILKKKVC